MRKIILAICCLLVGGLAHCMVPAAGEAQGGAPELRGPFLFLSTPYFEDGALDSETLAAEARFVDDCGAAGMVWPSSDQELLSAKEYRQGVDAVIAAMKGRRARLAICCNAASTEAIIANCRYAEKKAAQLGVDILLFARPASNLKTLEDLVASLDAIGAAIHRPFIFQTWLRKGFPNLPAAEMVALAKKYPGVMGYVKCEVPGAKCNDYIAEMIAAKPDIHAVFSAWGSWQWLYQARQLGTDGVLTQRPAYADVYAYIWREIQNGSEKADAAFGQMMSMLLMRSTIEAPDEHRSFHLYVLCKRGIFKNMVSRVADKKAPCGWKLHVQQLTDSQRAEVDLRLKALEPYMAIPLT